MNELVSVVTPVYNRKDLIPRAVRSVARQTFQHYEHIVVDDGSTDGSEGVVARCRNERMRYYRRPHLGRSAARNFGIQKANGTFISFLDSDDEYLPEALERLLRGFIKDSDPNVGLAYGGAVNGEGKAVSLVGHQSGHLFPSLLRRNFILPSACMVRASVLSICGLFNENLEIVKTGIFSSG